MTVQGDVTNVETGQKRSNWHRVEAPVEKSRPGQHNK